MRNTETNTRYQRLFAILYEATKMMNSGSDFRALLKFLAGEVMKLVGADSSTIVLLDEEQTELLCKAASGLLPTDEASISFRMGEGIDGWVAAHGVSALVPDVVNDGRYSPAKTARKDVASMLCVPIKRDNEVIGVLTVSSSNIDMFTHEDEETLVSLCSSVVQDFQNARLFQMSITDRQTRAYNRQYLFQRLPEEIERCRRYGNRLSVLLADIDHFSALNKEFGRRICDHLLKELSFLLQREIRDIDSLVRYGGEEFLILLPQTPLRDARRIAERIRRTVDKEVFHCMGNNLHMTVSIGIAEYAGVSDSEGFIRQADEALFAAKSKGRNHVENYKPSAMEPVSST